jgi:hypothetical protein
VLTKPLLRPRSCTVEVTPEVITDSGVKEMEINDEGEEEE